MAVEIQVIRFQKITGGGPTQDVNLNFTPKAIILFSEGSASDNTLTDHCQTIHGFSDGTNQATIASCSRDAAPTANTGRIHRNDAVFVRLDETTPTTTLDLATCTFATNKVTFNWSTLSATAVYIGMLAIAGDDITNCNVNTVDIGTTGTGNTDYTGLGFTPTSPNGILFTMAGDITTINTAATGAAISLNAAVSSTKRLGYGSASEHSPTNMDTWRYPADNKCLVNLDSASGAIDYDADFVDWISDGFRLNITDAAGATTEKFSYLAIKGGTWDIGTDLTRDATTGTKTTTVSVNSQTPKGLMIFSTELTVGTTWNASSTHTRNGFGISDGTTEFCMTAGDADAAATSVTARRNSSNNRIMNLILPNATATSSTNFLDADFSSFGTDAFTLNHTVVQAAGRSFGWIVVADEAAAAVAVEEIPAKSFGTIGLTNTTGNQTIFGGG